AQQEETVAFDIRKQAQEVILRDQQFALEQAVLQRSHDAVALLIERELFAELQVQRVFERGGISNGRDGAAGLLRLQQQPRVRGLLDRILKRKASAAQKRAGHTQNTGIARLI